MKKVYIKPSVMACEIVTEEMICQSLLGINEEKQTDGVASSNLDNFVNDFAGSDDSRSLW